MLRVKLLIICLQIHLYIWQETLHFNEGQTLSNMYFVKITIGQISVRSLQILNVGDNFCAKEKCVYLRLNVDHVSCNCPKSKFCFYCKGVHNLSICNNKKDKAKLGQLIVPEIMLLAFLQFFYQLLTFCWEIC